MQKWKKNDKKTKITSKLPINFLRLSFFKHSLFYRVLFCDFLEQLFILFKFINVHFSLFGVRFFINLLFKDILMFFINIFNIIEFLLFMSKVIFSIFFPNFSLFFINVFFLVLFLVFFFSLFLQKRPHFLFLYPLLLMFPYFFKPSLFVLI